MTDLHKICHDNAERVNLKNPRWLTAAILKIEKLCYLILEFSVVWETLQENLRGNFLTHTVNVLLLRGVRNETVQLANILTT